MKGRSKGEFLGNLIDSSQPNLTLSYKYLYIIVDENNSSSSFTYGQFVIIFTGLIVFK